MNHRLVGLHLRVMTDLFAVVEKARALELPIFQSFLRDASNKLIRMNNGSRIRFAEYMQSFEQSYFHVSYFANACEPGGYTILQRELALGNALGFTAAILHPGSGKWCGDKQQGMQVLIDALNDVLGDRRTRIPILLENSAHGNFSVGADVTDFAYILSNLRYPDLVDVCIDTAHAYVYGYDIADPDAQDAFVSAIDTAIGLKKIKLLHLNDTSQELGKCIDRHEVIGQGKIGATALARFANRPEFAHVPVILELPTVTDEQEQQAFRQAQELLRKI